MRIIAELPEKKHFKPIGHNEKWAYIFEAICTPKLRLYSPVADPWKMGEWSIRVRPCKGKSDKAEYSNRIDLQLSSPSEKFTNSHNAKIVWEFDKGIPHSNQPTLRFFAIPFVNTQGEAISLILSIVEVKDAKHSS